MPVAQSLMDALVKRYGEDPAKEIYASMEAIGKGPFAPGGKYRHLHEQWAERQGVRPSSALRSRTKTKKPRRSGSPKRRG